MKKNILAPLPAVAALFVLVSCSPVDVMADKAGSDNPVKSVEEGSKILDVKLQAPESAGHREYLGVKENQAFGVADIDADVVVVEIFSMYCPHCQREAPEVNRLFEKMTKSRRARGRMKLIGIGVGNSAYEVDLFRKSYDIKFPLFPDGEFVIHKQIGSVRTPTFIAVRNFRDKDSKVVFHKVGGVGDLDKFVTRILDLSGL